MPNLHTHTHLYYFDAIAIAMKTRPKWIEINAKCNGRFLFVVKEMCAIHFRLICEMVKDVALKTLSLVPNQINFSFFPIRTTERTNEFESSVRRIVCATSQKCKWKGNASEMIEISKAQHLSRKWWLLSICEHLKPGERPLRMACIRAQ